MANGWLSSTIESGCYCYSAIRIVLNNSDIISQWMPYSRVLRIVLCERVCACVCVGQCAHIHSVCDALLLHTRTLQRN